jgi:hypothetical protein
MTAEKPDRLAEFYGKVFGWTFRKWDGPMDYWMVTTGEGDMGINGGVLLRGPQMPAGTVNTVNVDSVDKALTSITSAGGKIAMEKMAVPGIGYLAYATDTEGNTFGVIEPDSAVA